MTHLLEPVRDARDEWVIVDGGYGRTCWHVVAETYRGDGADYHLAFVKTKCGIERMWDGSSEPEMPSYTERRCGHCMKPYWRRFDEMVAKITANGSDV